MTLSQTVAVKEEALLLSDAGLSLEADNAAKVLHFFGVTWRAATITEFLGYNRLSYQSSAKSRVLCSSDTFLELIRELEANAESIPPLPERVHSVFVYAGADRDALQELARILIGNEGAGLSRIDPGAHDFVVSLELDDFCGVMAGIRASASKGNFDGNLLLNAANGSASNIISLGRSAVFLKLEYKGIPSFFRPPKRSSISKQN